MKSLEYISHGVNVLQFRGDREQTIAQITLDSRLVNRGDLFIAIPGTSEDGSRFIPDAIRNGATCIVSELPVPPDLASTMAWIQVQNAREALGTMASNQFDSPSADMKVIGVTGTNGKTSVVYLLYQLFSSLGYSCGLISTIEICWPGYREESRLTTPDVISLQRMMRQMADAGVDYVFMEVSSHAVTQGRIDGIKFTGGIFTNLTHDHLDYHGTFANYLAAKKTFFDRLPASAFALINTDDRNGRVMVQNCAAKVLTYSMRTLSDVKGRVLENQLDGLLLKINERQIACRLVGDFNAYNLLAAYGCATALEMSEEQVLQALSGCSGARGRLEILRHPSGRIGIVDFAHTPDALEKVLAALNEIKPRSSRLLTVIGCGGNRDQAKRPVMGRIAARGSKLAIFTADNPRNEKAEDIMEAMIKGVDAADLDHVQVIADRRQAIQVTARMARAGDVILVAGKGHETYQDIGGVRHPFDDMQVLKEALEIPVIS